MDCNDYEYTVISMHNKYAMMVSLMKEIEKDFIKLETFKCVSNCINCEQTKQINEIETTIPNQNVSELIKNFTIDESEPEIVSMNNGSRIVRRTKKYMNELFEKLPDKSIRSDYPDNSRCGHYMRYYASSPKFNAILVNENDKMTLIKLKD